MSKIKKIIGIVCFICCSSIIFGQELQIPDDMLISYPDDKVKLCYFDDENKYYALFANRMNLNEPIIDTCGYTNDKMNKFKKSIELGLLNNIIGCGVRKPELILINDYIAVEYYFVSAFSIDQISFERTILVFANECIYKICLDADSFEEEIIEDMNEYFIVDTETKRTRWKDGTAIASFVDNWISHDCSDRLIELDMIYEKIKDSLKLTLQSGKCNDDRVRIRKYPNLDSDIVGILNLNDNVKIIDKTVDRYLIDGVEENWIRIKNEEGVLGWTFGKYIIIEETRP